MVNTVRSPVTVSQRKIFLRPTKYFSVLSTGDTAPPRPDEEARLSRSCLLTDTSRCRYLDKFYTNIYTNIYTVTTRGDTVTLGIRLYSIFSIAHFLGVQM